MWGTKLNIPSSAAGKAMELVGKAGKKTGEGDVLMWVGVKTDKKSGEMVGQLQGVRADRLLKNILNFFKGRSVATADDVLTHFRYSGMSEEQAQTALSKVTTDRGKAYMAKSVREQVDQFHDSRRAEVRASGKSDTAQARLLPNREGVWMSKTDIELTLNRASDGELPEYDPRT